MVQQRKLRNEVLDSGNTTHVYYQKEESKFIKDTEVELMLVMK